MVGYKTRNLSTIERRFLCASCSLLLKFPLRFSSCDHHLCQSCFTDEDPKSTVVCQVCHEKTLRENVRVDLGLLDEMQKILIECSLCDWSGLFRQYQKHLDENHSVSSCDFCQKFFSSVDDLTRHEWKECSRIVIECPLPQIGCAEKFPRSNLHEHLLSPAHQYLLSNFVRQIFYNVSSRHELAVQQRETQRSEVQQILQGLGHLSEGIDRFGTDIQRLDNENLYHQNALISSGRDVLPLWKAIEEKHFAVERAKATDEMIERDLSSIRQTVDEIALHPFDGTFIWKIPQIREKLAEAQSNVQTSYYSPPFYSSRNGYKMRLRLYPTGDGNARGTHLSLFFVLMRSEYDGIVKYPFCFKVIFCLWDQSGHNEHIIDSFRADARSNSFQRPRSEMNIASGLPKFVPLDVILADDNRFIRDDTIFIKVVIDFGNLSQRCLQELFQLNPAIPHQMKEMTQRNNDDTQPT